MAVWRLMALRSSDVRKSATDRNSDEAADGPKWEVTDATV
jgi:hypothetical protein